MNERDKETIKLVSMILGNIAAIAAGIALFDGKPQATVAAIFFGLLSYFSIRSLR